MHSWCISCILRKLHPLCFSCLLFAQPLKELLKVCHIRDSRCTKPIRFKQCPTTWTSLSKHEETNVASWLLSFTFISFGALKSNMVLFVKMIMPIWNFIRLSYFMICNLLLCVAHFFLREWNDVHVNIHMSNVFVCFIITTNVTKIWLRSKLWCSYTLKNYWIKKDSKVLNQLIGGCFLQLNDAEQMD